MTALARMTMKAWQTEADSTAEARQWNAKRTQAQATESAPSEAYRPVTPILIQYD